MLHNRYKAYFVMMVEVVNCVFKSMFYDLRQEDEAYDDDGHVERGGLIQIVAGAHTTFKRARRRKQQRAQMPVALHVPAATAPSGWFPEEPCMFDGANEQKTQLWQYGAPDMKHERSSYASII